MLNLDYIKSIRPRIEEAVVNLFDRARENEYNLNDFILFLCNGHIDHDLARSSDRHKYVVGPGLKGLHDENRIEFFVEYLNAETNRDLSEVEDEEKVKRIRRFTIQVELMIYTHLWENEMSLKDLKQLVNLAKGEKYDWENEIPEQGKYDFITDEIRSPLLDMDLDVGDLISECYRSQIRNAFAHGQCALTKFEHVVLHNYKGKDYQEQRVSFDRWEKVFTKAALLFYEVIEKRFEYIDEVSDENPEVTVWVPRISEPHKLQRAKLEWHEPSQMYSFKN
jgi:hypothetical protein